jgi:hypothetical protein
VVVKVISPEISISKVSGGLSVTNKSKTEFNLEGWRINSNNKDFVFPKDTIILAGKTIIFDDKVTGIYTENISIQNPLGKILATTNYVNIATTTNIVSIQNQINEVKDKLVKISSTKVSSSTVKKVVKIAQKPEIKKVEAEKNIEKTGEVANVVEVFKAPEKRSVSGVLAWPARGFNFIKHLFVEE